MKFERLFRAYICGTSAFGLVPRATLEIPGGTRRLDRILELIRSCKYAIHDLSRVEIDRTPPSAPRFNMPFDLGLSVASSIPNLAPHVGHKVEITGTAMSEAEAMKENKNVPRARHYMKVTAMKHISTRYP